MEKKEFSRGEDYPKNKNAEEAQNLRTLWYNFISEATVHGISKLTGRRMRIAFWSITILASFSYLLFIVTIELKQYYRYPIRTNVHVEHHSEMTFPALTICNLCWRNKSKLEDSFNHDAFYGSISEFGNFVGSPNWSDPWFEENGFFNETTEDFFFDQAMDTSKFLISCWFDTSYNLTCEQAFVPIFKPGGLCYTFNGDGKRRTTFSGSRHNLQMYVDVNSDSYTWSTEVGSGIQILAHEPRTNPDVTNHGVRIAPGSSVYAEITKRQYTYLEQPYRAFADQFCEKDFPTWSSSQQYSYTSQYCLQLCYATIVESKCKCRLVHHPGSGPICSHYQHQTCYIPTMRSVTGNVTITEGCSCKEPCHFSRYDISVSTAKFPSTFVRDVFINLNKTRASRMEIDGIFLHLYYKELVTEKIVQIPVYEDIGDVLAKVGGQMGLFLGASVVSILELGELGILSFLLMKRRCRNKIRSSSKDS